MHDVILAAARSSKSPINPPMLAGSNPAIVLLHVGRCLPAAYLRLRGGRRAGLLLHPAGPVSRGVSKTAFITCRLFVLDGGCNYRGHHSGARTALLPQQHLLLLLGG